MRLNNLVKFVSAFIVVVPLHSFAQTCPDIFSGKGDSLSPGGSAGTVRPIDPESLVGLRAAYEVFKRTGSQDPMLNPVRVFLSSQDKDLRSSEERSTWTFLRTEDLFQTLDLTPRLDRSGSTIVSAKGNVVTIATEVKVPGQPPRDALALTIDGQIHRVPYDPGTPPTTQTRERSFRTQAPVAALKMVGIRETSWFPLASDKNATRLGVVVIDEQGTIYLHKMATNETQVLRNVKVKRNGRELSEDEIKGLELSRLLPTNLITTHTQMHVPKDGYSHEIIHVSYLSAGGYEVTVESNPIINPEVKKARDQRLLLEKFSPKSSP